MAIDFTLADHGSIAIITPMSDVAKEWVDDYLSDETPWFANGFVVEHRYVDELIARFNELDMYVRPILVRQPEH